MLQSEDIQIILALVWLRFVFCWCEYTTIWYLTLPIHWDFLFAYWVVGLLPLPDAYLFSSGICTANISSGSRHWTTQPCLSLTLAVSTLRKVFGIRLHSTATMVCTSKRGGHWGTGFLCSLLNMADDSGIASWEQWVKKSTIKRKQDLFFPTSWWIRGFWL